MSSDWCMLLCGMFSVDPEGLEDSVWRGHYRHPGSQEKEGSFEEKTGTTLHQLLSDHVILKNPEVIQQLNHKPNLNWRQMKGKCTGSRFRQKRGLKRTKQELLLSCGALEILWLSLLLSYAGLRMQFTTKGAQNPSWSLLLKDFLH